MIALITNDQPYADNQERRSRQLLLVYGIMAVAGMAAAVVPQVLLRGSFLGNLTVIAAGLLLVTGIWSTAVSSIPYGVVGGGLVGMVFTLSGTIVHLVNSGVEPAESMKLLVASTVISSILGSLLGLAGGVVVWAFRLRRSPSSMR
jgi:uncharacterized membrane protein YccC